MYESQSKADQKKKKKKKKKERKKKEDCSGEGILKCSVLKFCKPKFLNKMACANKADPDQ